MSRFIPAVGSARRRAVRAVEQLDEVEHPRSRPLGGEPGLDLEDAAGVGGDDRGCILDRKSTRLNSSHGSISYAVFCLKKKKKQINRKNVYRVEDSNTTT